MDGFCYAAVDLKPCLLKEARPHELSFDRLHEKGYSIKA